MTPLTGRAWWLGSGLALALALIANVPTTGDLGLTWDEPAYRHSQELSGQWWERWGSVRTWAEVEDQFDPDVLLYYWPYGRHGINFHPPLAGQLNLLTYALAGGWMKDVPARRLASVLEYSATIALLFGFLASRSGPWAGGVAAGALLFMPRVYGDGHVAATDMPGLLIWSLAAVSAWKGLRDPEARRWRVLVGVLVGLAFVEKMGAVLVVLPIVGWLVAARLPRTIGREGARGDWIDGVLTTTAMLVPLGIAYLEIRRLAPLFPPPSRTNLFLQRPPSTLPGAILLGPLIVWIARRLVGRWAKGTLWAIERPALEIGTAILAIAPAVAWLGNPAWWRETLPRLAHYYALSTDRRGALPDIQILYAGKTYIYSLPWENAWVLLAITVPVSLLAGSVAGLLFALVRSGRDRLPLYFLAHLAILPAMRMLATPAHDGVRLFLPTFFFLAALVGWGTAWVGIGIARLSRSPRIATGLRAILAALVLGPAAWQLIRVHPFELSYYNELIGGPRGAWDVGFELSYWFDAFNDRALADLNARLPLGATVVFPTDKTPPPTFVELQGLGALRPDVRLGDVPPDQFPSMWLLTQDSKASSFTRLLFAMDPWYALRPRQLDGARVAAVMGPEAASRAWALDLLTHRGSDVPPAPEPRAPLPDRLRRVAPWLGRFWGEGLTRAAPPGLNEAIFDWARSDPDGLRAAARTLTATDPGARPDDPGALALRRIMARPDGSAEPFLPRLFRGRPEALCEAIDILIRRPIEIRAVLNRAGYTDPDRIGGPLDRGVRGCGPTPSIGDGPVS